MILPESTAFLNFQNLSNHYKTNLFYLQIIPVENFLNLLADNECGIIVKYGTKKNNKKMLTR